MKLKTEKYTFNVRKATWQDYQFCYRVTKSSMEDYVIRYFGSWAALNYHKKFDPNEVEIITKNNKRFGYYILKSKPKFLFIDKIHLSGSIRGKGVGTKLIEMIENKAKKSKKESVRLEVFTDNPAKKLYERLGYKIIDKPKDYLLLMEKRV